MYQPTERDIMNTMTRIALGTIALLAPLAVLAPAGAAPKGPHACSSHSDKVVTSKCPMNDIDGDGRVPDRYPYDYTR